jgi:beta-fructofuranosidase
MRARSKQRRLPCCVGPHRPILGAFQRIYDPSADQLWPTYINDHAFVLGPEQTWHLLGITRDEPGLVAKDEHEFAHASSATLIDPMWANLPNAPSAAPAFGETLLWVPYVIEQYGKYLMFYGGGGGASYQIRLASSTDLATWLREPAALFVDGYEARDPFVLRVGAQWIIYYTATDLSGGHHVVAYHTSADLSNWGERAIAYTDPATGTGAGPNEFPFVVARDEGYSLFIGSSEDYLATRVFFSEDPRFFSAAPIAAIQTHAAEIVRDVDGQEYISRTGWGQGGVFPSKLSWQCPSS